MESAYRDEVTGRGQLTNDEIDHLPKMLESLKRERAMNAELRDAIAQEINRVNAENSELRVALQASAPSERSSGF